MINLFLIFGNGITFKTSFNEASSSNFKNHDYFEFRRIWFLIKVGLDFCLTRLSATRWNAKQFKI